VAHRHRHGAVRRQRLASGQQLENEHPDRVLICAVGRFLPVDDLGRHVVDAADQRAGRGVTGRGRRPGDAEVGDLRVPASGDQDVLGLDVAMNDVAGVRPRQRLAHRPDYGEHLGGRQAPSAVEQLAHRGPVHQLHHDVGQVGHTLIEHVDDVGMQQCRRVAGLGAKPRQE
jgi:hypothetical protein